MVAACNAKPSTQQCSPQPKGATMRNLTYCVALVILACTSEATFAADADNGLRLAQRWCTSCHIVSSA